MTWDIWALLSIIVLCSTVIVWSGWGYYRELHPEEVDSLRLHLIGGGHLDVPLAPDHPTGRHRAPHFTRLHLEPTP
ncbi:hypothetical protein [Nocardia sp. NBC_01388]|uniref:hypothetical protein n=1 Tax=Nocardia sp. NBC_01388 TaxID=2903596 RepID=UPI003256703C